jgi:hypothetical protein
MAHILVIRHADEPDDFSVFSMHILCEIWSEAGHRVSIAKGLDRLPDADLAIMHVNLSVLPEDYRQAATRYPRVVNGGALDIRKRNVSRSLVTRDDPWTGSVVVKSDLNFGGVPEWTIAHQGHPPSSMPPGMSRYYVKAGIAEVPEEVWSDPQLVVERFLPEWENQRFHLRTWVFLGDRGRCRRSKSKVPIIKGFAFEETEPELLEIPEEIRAERARLGIDYGKFDFALHRGQPVLYDANKTPGIGPARSSELYRELAAGLDGLLA